VSAAGQIYYESFDAVFLSLPPTLRARVESMRSVCDWLLTLTTALKEPIASALASAIIGSSTPSTSREIRFTSSRSDIGVTFIASRANIHRPYMDAFAIECLKHSGSANAEVVWLP
jgi:hypothetical protein